METVRPSGPGTAGSLRIRRRSSHGHRRRLRRNLALTGFLTVFFLTLGGLWFIDFAPPPVPEYSGPPIDDTVLSERAALDTATDRPVYRYSVVPGGVRSAEEVARVMARDPVVAAHYSDINVQGLRRERLEQPMVAHVSYRVGDRVYFTSKPVRIGAGEYVLTDGQKTIRERCGNVISVDPVAPPAAKEPPLDQLDQVIAPVAPPAGQMTSAAPTGGVPGARSLDVPPSPVPAGDPPTGVPPAGGSPPGGPGGIPPGSWPPPPPFVPPGTTPPGGTPTPFDNPPPGPTPTPTPPGPTPTPTPTPPPIDPPFFPPPVPPEPPLPVPEPSTFVLVGLGGAVALAKALRHRRARK